MIAHRAGLLGRRRRPRTGGLALLATMLLAACAVPPGYRPSSTPTQPAGASALPAAPPDTAAIPDAVPRIEPRSSLGNPPFYEVDGHRYVVLSTAAGYDERGVASWYGPGFHGLHTATGEPYDMFAMTAAHKTLPLPCYARVTNLSNGRSVVVRINDRGPFVANRIIDLSYTAAAKLGMLRAGTAFVEVQTLMPSAPPTQTVSLPANSAPATVASLGPSSVPPLSAAAAAALPLAPATAADTPASVRTPTTASVSAAAAPATHQFYIQVGAFAQLQNAQRTASRLRTAGLSAFMLAPDTREALLRVRIGPIATVQQFDAVIARLRTLGYPGARLAQD